MEEIDHGLIEDNYCGLEGLRKTIKNSVRVVELCAEI
jgi:hypothetical protein